MEPLHHGPQDQSLDKQPAGWTAVNKPALSPIRSMESPSGGTMAMQGTRPPMPMSRTGANLLRTSVASTVRPLQPLLPRPQTALRTQPNPKPCPVCGRSSCTLTSHKHFAEYTLARRRSSLKQPVTPTKGKMAVRPSQTASSRPPEHIVNYPIAMDNERQQLLSLWSREWGRVRRGPERHLYPTPWIDAVIPTAMTHAALFQALLATSASMWAMAHTTLSESTTRQLQLADQILSQTCTTSQIAQSEECLLAALLITIVHQAQGNAHETDARFSNIVRLVVDKGGPHYLKMSGIVADILLYVDYLQAVLLDCEPVWPLPLPPLQIGIPPRLGSAFRDLVATNTFRVEILQAADSICRTTDIFEQSPDSSTRGSGPMNAFGYLSTIAEYQLAHCNAVFHGSHTWNECICLALLLFNHVVLRNDGAMTAPMRKLERQFWQTVDDTILQGGFRDVPPCLLLWLFITGLSPCILSDCQYRFSAVKRMRAARISAAINGWENFQVRVLDDFVWVRAAQEEAFRDVWLEVEGYKNLSSPAG